MGFHPIFNIVIGAAVPLITGVYVGIADRAAEIACELATARRDDPTVQWSIGEMQNALVLARGAHARMVALADELRFAPSTELSSEMLSWKTHGVQAAATVVERAIEAVGGRGYFRRTGLERLLRDVRAGDYHPLPAKQQLRFSGRVALGLDTGSAAAPREAPPAGVEHAAAAQLVVATA